MTRYAWLQKHPTPAARGGEFHWYPSDGDRELYASFAERLPAATGGALWQLAPGEVAWALPFVAVAPDGRRYTGLALAVAESLAQLVPAVAAPWTEATTEPVPATPPALPDLAGVARALLDGGNAAVGAPEHVGLPRAIAAVERVMPARGKDSMPGESMGPNIFNTARNDPCPLRAMVCSSWAVASRPTPLGMTH